MEHNHLEELQLEVMEDEAPKVWEEYRTYGPADLEAIIRWLKPRLQETISDLEERLDDGSTNVEQLVQRSAEMKIRHATAQRMLDIRIRGLHAPVPWEEKDESTLDSYEPAPKPKRILQAIARLDDEREGLSEVEYKTNIYRPVAQMIENGEAGQNPANRLNQNLRKDMKAQGVNPPGTPKQLVRVANRLAQRWDNFPPFSEPDR